VKIIVNKDNAISSISQDQLSRIFLKKSTKWENGNKVVPVDLTKQHKTRTVFSKSIHGKSVSAIQAYWQKKIYTGKGVPPAEQKNDQAVVVFVRSNPGAIGYISSSTSTSGVKVIKITN
jgi:ABC-type phosphate transport system substrate-binding protein